MRCKAIAWARRESKEERSYFFIEILDMEVLRKENEHPASNTIRT
jgi:hypothetical protein